jgi:hypothetical protein
LGKKYLEREREAEIEWDIHGPIYDISIETRGQGSITKYYITVLIF